MNAQLELLFDPIRKILARHHPFIFIAIAGIGLAAAIYSLTVTLSLSSAPSDSVSAIGGFDKKTIDQIKNLHDSNESEDTVVFPTPRSNPFVE